jgi:hypothetical protein
MGVLPMALLAVNWSPPRRQLRVFGWVAAALLAAVALRLGPSPAALALELSAAAVFVIAALWPSAVRVLYVPLAALTAPVGWAVGTVLLALVYYLILTPLALVLRLCRRDALRLRADGAAESYWEPREQVADPRRYFRQY